MTASAAVLPSMAARLVDMAGIVSREAEAATASLRGMTEEARTIADLAGQLEDTAALVEAGARAQRDALADARRTLAANHPAVQALAQSVETVRSISDLLGRIATDSRMLSLNARIEASRAGSAGAPFSVVAQALSGLAEQTKGATDEIGRRTDTVARDMGAAHELLSLGASLVATSDGMAETAAAASDRQRSVAAAMTAVTRGAAARIDDAAAAIGRVGATAVAVRLLAEQVGKVAAAG